MVDVNKLKIDEEYIIITKTKYKNKILLKTYTGICVDRFDDVNKGCLFANVAYVNKPYDKKYAGKPMKIFTKWDQYIELKQMKIIINNAKMTRQNMEKRDLDMILKRIMNETFEW